ncbi:homogentisate 1,2-dioxygenase [Brumimicrobium glaciale]|jgi:homogentisate 1,2-dioxygenase|uniref:Homogentisate 1,2-dioxygenase n=1 Tax=Brumimicrobium glaciale TaxID=200475 RepID=A0A4V1WFQ3_9FLAO|nr:homogentisate 1,2-dioxygenase [Brumimicrobium glaciale]RYM33996.1 homogentisate 1,2-dioxygenase [Brumimicrobium glaciale]
MPFYSKLGKIPHKRHTTFKKEEGGYYYEQLFGTEGFSGTASLIYHVHRPTMVKEIGETIDLTPYAAVEKSVRSQMLNGFNVRSEEDFLDSRKIVMFNDDLNIALASPQESMKNYFYKNADADEMIFVHEGTGTLKTMLGNIPFGPGDYLIVPRGIIYQIHFDGKENRLFIVESFSPMYTPKRYRNEFGQLLEHSPYCERDFRAPSELETNDEKGEFLMKIKKQNVLHHLTYASHPFDVVGWDGYNFPYAINIKDFEPITGRVHLPPPIHQQFEAHNFVICSFVPRMYDYHPEAVPAPYNHSNIDSDELLYYVDGDFMSRNHVERGFISLHPMGIPHGPHPGAMERSIGKKETGETAVMVDTFKPLKLTQTALDISDKDYAYSWLED